MNDLFITDHRTNDYGFFDIVTPVKRLGSLSNHKFKRLANSVMWLLNKLTQFQATFIRIMISSMNVLLYTVKSACRWMISFYTVAGI